MTTENNFYSTECVSVIYEAFFLDNEEIIQLFSAVRGAEPPYENVTKDFHVTTAFRPKRDKRRLYGTEVSVHIYAYKNGTVKTDEGNMTSNEGFFCTVSSENPQMQKLIDRLENNNHITGSYELNPKYTGFLELNDAQPVDFFVKGRFGGFFSDGKIYFSPPKPKFFCRRNRINIDS